MSIFQNKQKLISKCLGVSAIAVIGILNSTVANAATFVTETRDVVLDFDTYTNGKQITTSTASNQLGIGNQWEDWGVRISATKKNNSNKSEPLLLFNSNSNSHTGNDDDLRTGDEWGTTIQNNVLIIHKNGWEKSNRQIVGVKNANNPDDKAGGGNILFEFDNAVQFQGFSLLDMDDDQDSRGNYLEVFLTDINNNRTEIDVLSLIENVSGYQNSYTSNGVTVTQDSKVRGDNSMYSFTTDRDGIVKVEYKYPGSGAIAGLKWRGTVRKRVPEPATLLGLGLVASGMVVARRRRSVAG